MHILDIDLDLFLDDRKIDGANRRPLNSEYKPWEPFAVRRFLESQCGLSKEQPLVGAVFEEHDELFFHLRALSEKGLIECPFDIVHADAHADVGLGGMNCTAFNFVTTEWLARPPEYRTFPPIAGSQRLFNGSWLLYAMACRWIRSLIYVHHPRLRKKDIDFPIGLIEDENVDDMVIQLNLVESGLDRYRDKRIIASEPPIPFSFVRVEDFVARPIKFDRVFLTHSPKYTPPAADHLLGVVAEYIQAT